MKYIITILFLIAPVFAHAQTALQTATATLTWDSNPEPDMDSYIMMMGEASGVYSQAKPITHIKGVASQTGEFSGLAEGKTYFFIVKSCDITGNCSAPSQEVSGSVAVEPDVTAPSNPSGLGVTIKLILEIVVP